MSDEPREAKLFRVLQAQAGVSRRTALDLVRAGEVEVDGSPVDDPFLPLDPGVVQRLALRGHPLSLAPREPRIYRFHKPAGMLCSHDDPHCGDTVGRFLRAEGFLGYAWVGRLDQDAEGLLLLSNDGALIQAMSHPRYEVHKTYRVWLAESPPPRDVERALRAMQTGIEDEGETLHLLDGHLEKPHRTVVVSLGEGRKHEVKRLFARFGWTVTRLLRIAIGSTELGALAPGAAVRLPRDEETHLLEEARRLLGTSEDAPDDVR